MTERTSRETVSQALADFDSIREAIQGHKIEVPYPTKTSVYADLIAGIGVGSITGTVYHDIKIFPVETIAGSAESYIFGFCIEAIAGNMEDDNSSETTE